MLLIKISSLFAPSALFCGHSSSAHVVLDPRSTIHDPRSSILDPQSSIQNRPSDSEVLLRVENVTKIFCRDLKKSLLYGLQDSARDLMAWGKRSEGEKLKQPNANQVRQETRSLQESLSACDGGLRAFKVLSGRKARCFHQSDPSFLTLNQHEPARGLGQASLRSAFHFKNHRL